MKKIFTISEKGGVGKTFHNIIIAMYFWEFREDKKAVFVDLDGRSCTLTKWMAATAKKREKRVSNVSFPLIDPVSKDVQPAKFLKLIQNIEKIQDQFDYCFMDLGAETSTKFNAMLFKIEDTLEKLIQKDFNFIAPFCKLAFRDCLDFFLTMPELVQQNAIILENQRDGKIPNFPAQLKTNRKIVLPEADFEKEVEDYFCMIFEKHLSPKELKDLMFEREGSIFAESKAFGGKIFQFIKEYGDQVANILR